MHVTVFGSGYVGLVAGACFAETGNDVVCADIDARKVERLQANELPIYEPGLEPIVRRNQAEGRLRFTTDLAAAVRHGDKEIHRIEGATHYYIGPDQKPRLAQAVGHCRAWLARHGWSD